MFIGLLLISLYYIKNFNNIKSEFKEGGFVKLSERPLAFVLVFVGSFFLFGFIVCIQELATPQEVLNRNNELRIKYKGITQFEENTETLNLSDCNNLISKYETYLSEFYIFNEWSEENYETNTTNDAHVNHIKNRIDELNEIKQRINKYDNYNGSQNTSNSKKCSYCGKSFSGNGYNYTGGICYSGSGSYYSNCSMKCCRESLQSDPNLDNKWKTGQKSLNNY